MDTGEAVAPPGVSSPGRGVTATFISNMGPRPAPLLGTIEQNADEFVRRVDFAMAHFAGPVIVNGLLRRHFVAHVTGLGRTSQAAVLEYLAAQGAIELITKDGEQWLSRQRGGRCSGGTGLPASTLYPREDLRGALEAPAAGSGEPAHTQSRAL